MRICQKEEIPVGDDSSPKFRGRARSGGDAVDTGVLLLEERAMPGGEERRYDGQMLRGGSKEEIILALYDEYRPRLYRYMRSMHLGRECADEIIQETFMRLTMELLKENKIENIQGWVVRVAHNLAINLLKRERGTVVSEEARSFLIQNRVDPALSPEESYSKKEQANLMQAVLSSVKPQHRQCFQMRVQGIAYKDIGQAFGFSEQRAAFVVRQVAVRLAAVCGVRNGGPGDL